jgi:hypothetical protein
MQNCIKKIIIHNSVEKIIIKSVSEEIVNMAKQNFMLYGGKLLIDVGVNSSEIEPLMKHFIKDISVLSFKDGPEIYGLSSINGRIAYVEEDLLMNDRDFAIITIEHEMSHNILRYNLLRNGYKFDVTAKMISPQKYQNLKLLDRNGNLKASESGDFYEARYRNQIIKTISPFCVTMHEFRKFK